MPDVAIGAIVAALIAGLISLIGLIVSKEQKTSEFRQSWIDALREEMAVYITSINALHDALKVEYASYGDKVDKLSPIYAELNKVTLRIQLRTNPEEDGHKPLRQTMDKIKRLSADEDEMTLANLKPLETVFIIEAQKILKHEWKRVKRGEPAFVVAKLSAVSFVVIAALAVGAIGFRGAFGSLEIAQETGHSGSVGASSEISAPKVVGALPLKAEAQQGASNAAKARE